MICTNLLKNIEKIFTFTSKIQYKKPNKKFYITETNVRFDRPSLYYRDLYNSTQIKHSILTFATDLLFVSEKPIHFWNINKYILCDFIEMEQQNIKLNKFKFDATPYIIAANSFSKQFKKQENKSSDHALSKLDATISENLKECSNIQEDMKIIRAENVNTQQKLDILKWEEKQQSQCGFDLKEGCILFQ